MKRTRVAVLGVALGVLAIAGPASAQTDKVDRALRDAIRAGARTQNVIISVKPGHLAGVRRALEDHGDLVKADHASIGALSAEIHADDISELARQPWVEGVSLDADVFAIGARDVNASGAPAATGKVTQTQPDAPNTRLRESLGLAAVAGAGSPTGKGIVVAIIDSGLSLSADLDASRVLAFYDFTRPGCLRRLQRCATAPSDDLGHGTHVAGLIGSSGALSRNLYQGVAPQVKFVGIKVLKADGSGKTSDVITAIEFVTKNRRQWGAQVVINLSLGHTIFTPAILDPLVRAVEQASAAGIVVVVAAGNNTKPNTYAGITSPANAPSALTTGAVETNRTPVRGEDVVAGYSARGPTWFDAYAKPDFVAPGSRLISDTTIESTLFKIGGSKTIGGAVYQIPDLSATGYISIDGHPFLQLSGTSMAAGVVSGVVALVLEANRHGGAPPLTPNAVKAILQYTATPLTTNTPDRLTQGVGQINAAGAVALARQVDTTAPLGGWWLRNGVDESTQFGLPDGISCTLPNCEIDSWAKNITWGTDVLGGDLVYHNLLIWSRNILWGTDVVWDTDRTLLRGTTRNILWGTGRNIFRGTSRNILWGTRILQGSPVLMIARGNQAAVNTILWGRPSGPDVLTENIVWSTSGVWGNSLTPGRVVGMREGGTITWGTLPQSLTDGDNILWGTWDGDNILWGTWDGDNILWGTMERDGDIVIRGTSIIDGDNILWGTWDGDNILWGTSASDGDNILWGTSVDGDNILWGTSATDGDNILWGTAFRRGGGF